MSSGSIDIAALPPQGVYVVYRIYWADTLVYVGMTNHLLRRLSQHMSGDMRYQIGTVEWTEFETRYEAETAEAVAIRRMAPSLNIVGNR